MTNLFEITLKAWPALKSRWSQPKSCTEIHLLALLNIAMHQHRATFAHWIKDGKDADFIAGISYNAEPYKDRKNPGNLGSWCWAATEILAKGCACSHGTLRNILSRWSAEGVLITQKVKGDRRRFRRINHELLLELIAQHKEKKHSILVISEPCPDDMPDEDENDCSFLDEEPETDSIDTKEPVLADQQGPDKDEAEIHTDETQSGVTVTATKRELTRISSNKFSVEERAIDEEYVYDDAEILTICYESYGYEVDVRPKVEAIMRKVIKMAGSLPAAQKYLTWAHRKGKLGKVGYAPALFMQESLYDEFVADPDDLKKPIKILNIALATPDNDDDDLDD